MKKLPTPRTLSNLRYSYFTRTNPFRNFYSSSLSLSLSRYVACNLATRGIRLCVSSWKLRVRSRVLAADKAILFVDSRTSFSPLALSLPPPSLSLPVLPPPILESEKLFHCSALVLQLRDCFHSNSIFCVYHANDALGPPLFPRGVVSFHNPDLHKPPLFHLAKQNRDYTGCASNRSRGLPPILTLSLPRRPTRGHFCRLSRAIFD